MRINITRKELLCSLICFLIGIYLLIYDIDVAGVYFSVFLITLLLFVVAFKKRNFLLIIFFAVLLLTQGLNPVLFFSDEEGYVRQGGYNAVGDFDFDVVDYLKVYSYVFVFMCSVLIVSSFIIKKKDECETMEYIKRMINNRLDTQRKQNTCMVSALLYIVCILGVTLSIWMYYNQVGIRGLPQTELPFHLTGILYYVRNFFISGAVVLLYVKAKKTVSSLVVVCIYALIAGVAGSSRAIVSIVLLPILLISFIEKKTKRGIVVLIVFSIMYLLVTLVRDDLFMYNTIRYSISELLGGAFARLVKLDMNVFEIIFDLIYQLSGRLYGAQSVVLGSQYYVDFTDFFNYYLGMNISQIMNNLAEDLFGLVLLPGMTFGVSLGYIGQMVSFSGGNYLLSALQGGIVAIILCIAEHCLSRTIVQGGSTLKILCILALSMLAIMLLWLGESMLAVYGIIVCVCVIKKVRFPI